MLARSRRLLVTILLSNLLVNVTYFAFTASLAGRLMDAGRPVLAIATPLASLMLIVIFGEIIPKVLAVSRPALVARSLYRMVLVLEILLAPFRIVLGGIATGILRLMVSHREEEGALSTEELSHLLEVAGRAGQFQEDELESIQAALLLDQMSIKEIMVPRVQIVAFPVDGSRDDLLDLIGRKRHNKIPVYAGDRDRIIGFVDAKSVLGRPDATLEELLQPVQFIPDTARVAAVMERFTASRQRLMIVVDEHGGTEGMVTHEDLVEAVIGDLSDEGADSEPMVRARPDGSFDVDPRLGVRRMVRLLAGGIPRVPVHTMGGLVMMLLGRIPRVGDTVRTGPLEVEVTAVRKQRPSRLLVRPAPDPQETAPGDGR